MHAADHGTGWLGIIAVVCAAIATVILLTFLFRKPQIGGDTKVWLLLGLGVLPIATAVSANIQGFHSMETREFCGSCHVMIPHASDSDDRTAIRSRRSTRGNRSFGSENCYTCHKDYGMYGFVSRSFGRLRHVYYYLTEYHDMPLGSRSTTFASCIPLPNDTCMGLPLTTNAPRWKRRFRITRPSRSTRSGNGTLSCASRRDATASRHPHHEARQESSPPMDGKTRDEASTARTNDEALPSELAEITLRVARGALSLCADGVVDLRPARCRPPGALTPIGQGIGTFSVPALPRGGRRVTSTIVGKLRRDARRR